MLLFKILVTCLTGLTGAMPGNSPLGNPPAGAVSVGRPPMKGPGTVLCGLCILSGGGPLPPKDEFKKGRRLSAVVGDTGCCLIGGSSPPRPSGTPAKAFAAVKSIDNKCSSIMIVILQNND